MDFEFGKIVITDTVTNTRILQDELAEYGSLHLVYTGADDRFQIIMPSELQFNFLVSDGSDAKYFHLLTAYEQRYKVELMVYDETETYLSTLWQGYLLPEQFNEPYQSGKFFINFNATDGLGLLKGKGYNILNQFGKTSITSLLSSILSATGLQLPFYISPAIENATATVLVSQIEVDTNSYKDEAKDKGGILMDYYDVLENILTVLGCKIFQYNGAWYLVGINRFEDATINFEHYNSLGAFQGFAPYVRTEKPIFFRDSANVNVQFPFNSVTVEWDAKEPENIFPEDLAFQGVPVTSPWTEILGYPAKYWSATLPAYAGTGLNIFLNDKDGVYFAPPEDGVWRVQAGYVSFDTATTTANIDANYIELASPIFVSPPQETYFICNGTIRFANAATEGVDFTGAVPFEILLNDVVILSNKSSFATGTNYDFKYTASDNNVNFSLEVEILTLKENGYLNIRFYAFDNAIHTGFTSFVFHQIELNKKEKTNNYTTVEGNYQSSLKKSINSYYGSSLNDLTDKKLFVSGDVSYDGTTITYPAFNQQVPVLIYKEEVLVPGLSWHLALINASDYILLTEYKDYIKIKSDGVFMVPDDYAVLDGDPTSSSEEFTGYYFGQLVDPGTAIAFDATDEIWIDKPVTIETVTVRNYIEELWKPINDTVGTSVMEALAKVYKNSISDYLFRLSGNALGLYGPLDLISFNYIDNKNFIPINLSLDLSEGETNLVVIEPRNEAAEIVIPAELVAPTNLTAGIPTQTTIPLTWTKSVSGVMTEYRVYNDGIIIETFVGDVSSGILTDLIADTTYDNLTVKAFNGALESDASNSVSKKTLAEPPIVIAPPSGLVLTESEIAPTATDITITTESNLLAWSPTSVVNTGNTLYWDVDGSELVVTNDPTFNLEDNVSTVDINAFSSDDFIGVTNLSLTALEITAVDLLALTSLRELEVKQNSSLQSIDISTMYLLGEATLRSNDLQLIDLSGNTALWELYIYNNPDLAVLDISNNPLITILHAYGCSLPQAQLDDIVINLDTFGLSNGNLNITSQTPAATLSSAAYDAYNGLVSKGWTLNGLVQPPASIPAAANKPVLSNFRINNTQPYLVYFDSTADITGLTINGFIISGKIVSGINTTDKYFTVSTPFTFWDNNTIRFEGNSSGNNVIYDFTMEYIVNNINEPTASINKFVSTTATGTNNGTTEALAWTFAQAVTNATAGMTVWVKAGNYGDLELTFTNSGTVSNPIKFIGYKTSTGVVPNEITSNYYDYGVTWSTAEMPTITNGTTSTSGKTGFKLSGSYIIFKNFQQTNGYRAINAPFSTVPHHIVIERFNSKDNYSSTNVNASGISLITNYTTGLYNIRIKNCVVVNASMKSICIQATSTSHTQIGHNLISGCKIYSDNITTPERSDYCIDVNGHDNIIKNCYGENFNDTETNSSTHGIGVRGGSLLSSTYNLLVDNETVNYTEGLYVRNYGSNYNVIKRNIIRGNGSPSFQDCGGIWIWGGSDYNIIENNKVYDLSYCAIGLNDNQEEENWVGVDVGTGNIIRNNIFYNNAIAIYSASTSAGAEFTDGYIYNNTFYNNYDFYKRGNTNVTLVNVSFKNNIIQGATANSSGITAGMTFEYNNFYGNGTWDDALIAGTNTGVNPSFVDLVSFVPQGALQTAPKISGVNYDYNGSEREDVTTIGAVILETEIIE